MRDVSSVSSFPFAMIIKRIVRRLRTQLLSNVAIDYTRIFGDIPLGKGVKLLYIDENGLIALEKPNGILSHPNTISDIGRSLIRSNYCAESESYMIGRDRHLKSELWLLHRLDSSTSGIILVSLNREVAYSVKKLFSKNIVHKRYYALCFPKYPIPHQLNDSLIWKDKISIDHKDGKVRAVQNLQHLKSFQAESEVFIVKKVEGIPEVVLLEMRPTTGRTHQLRYQCSIRNLPIVGDKTYGDFKLNRSLAKKLKSSRLRLYLHCFHISFAYTCNGKTYQVLIHNDADFFDTPGLGLWPCISVLSGLAYLPSITAGSLITESKTIIILPLQRRDGRHRQSLVPTNIDRRLH